MAKLEERVSTLEETKADRIEVKELEAKMMAEFASLRSEMNEGFTAINRIPAILIARTEPLISPGHIRASTEPTEIL